VTETCPITKYALTILSLLSFHTQINTSIEPLTTPYNSKHIIPYIWTIKCKLLFWTNSFCVPNYEMGTQKNRYV